MSHQENAQHFKRLLPQLREPAVIDLAWSVFSQPLISKLETADNILIPCFPLTAPRIEWLKALDANPQSLHTHLKQPKTKRLGQLYEALWEYFLLHDQSTDLLAKNLQVQHRGKTYGEFDFIYRDKDLDQIIHLELAIKLYLGFPMDRINSSSPMNWWQGPNCIDRLDLKIAKLFNKQLALGTSEYARQQLADLNIDSVQAALFLGGYLFYPRHESMTAPGLIDSQHQKGSWYFLDNIQQDLDSKQGYLPLTKPAWLCPHLHRTRPDLLSPAELHKNLSEQFQRWGRPVLVSAVCHTDNGWQEQQRFFVVPDQWPVVLFEHRG